MVKTLRRLDARTNKKRVLITGGASGIGAATAARFLEEGSAVVVLDRDAMGRAQKSSTAARTRRHRGRRRLQSASSAAALDEAVRLMGGVDVLVNNAGISIRHNFLEITPEEWDKIIGGESHRRLLHGADRRPPHVGARRRRNSADRLDQRHGRAALLCRLQCHQSRSDRADQIHGARTRAQNSRLRRRSGIRAHAHAARRIHR